MNERLILGINKSSSLVFLYDNDGDPRAAFTIGRKGYPRLAFWTKSKLTAGGQGKYGRTTVGADGLQLSDEDGNVRAVFGSTDLDYESGSTENTGPFFNRSVQEGWSRSLESARAMILESSDRGTLDGRVKARLVLGMRKLG